MFEAYERREDFSSDYDYMVEKLDISENEIFEGLDLSSVRLKGLGVLNLLNEYSINYSKKVYEPQIPKIETYIVEDAIEYLGTCLDNDYNIEWVRIQVPLAEDLDIGEGTININNEEQGGTSDYWVMFYIKGMPYSEAPYLNKSAPTTMWGVQKPLWNLDPVDVEVKMYEMDFNDHKDEHMDILSGSGKDVKFIFHPSTQEISGSHVDQYEYYRIPEGGYFIKSSGNGDLRARIYLKIWVMSDKRVEFIAKTVNWIEQIPPPSTLSGHGGNQPYIASRAPFMWVDIGPNMWFLNRPDYDEFLSGKRDCFTYDLGTLSNSLPDLIQRLRIYNDNFWEWNGKSFFIQINDFKFGEIFSEDEYGLRLDKIYTFEYGKGDYVVLPWYEAEAHIEHFSVYTRTLESSDEDVDEPVYIIFYSKKGGLEFKLDNFIRDEFQSDKIGFFWLERQVNINPSPYCHQINDYRINDIFWFKIYKTGSSNLDFEEIEIWANGKILYKGEPRKTINYNYEEWEVILTIPKREISFIGNPEITDLGIHSIMLDSGSTFAHKYRVDFEVGFNEYMRTPDLEFILSPSHPTTEIDVIENNPENALFCFYLYLNKEWNDLYNCALQVVATDEEVSKDVSISFSLPKPRVHIEEILFEPYLEFIYEEIDQLLEHGKVIVGDVSPYWRGIYRLDHSFADVIVSWNPDGAFVLFESPEEIELVFSSVDKTKYTVEVQAEELNGTESASDFILINMPMSLDYDVVPDESMLYEPLDQYVEDSILYGNEQVVEQNIPSDEIVNDHGIIDIPVEDGIAGDLIMDEQPQESYFEIEQKFTEPLQSAYDTEPLQNQSDQSVKSPMEIK